MKSKALFMSSTVWLQISLSLFDLLSHFDSVAFPCDRSLSVSPSRSLVEFICAKISFHQPTTMHRAVGLFRNDYRGETGRQWPRKEVGGSGSGSRAGCLATRRLLLPVSRCVSKTPHPNCSRQAGCCLARWTLPSSAYDCV